MVVNGEQISDPLAPGHMTPTVLMEFGHQRPMKRAYDEMALRGVSAAAPRGYTETVGESEGAPGSPVRSEDSAAPKRKCISLNSDGFDVKREIFVPSKMSSSERRYLRKRFRAELDSIRVLLKKPEFSVPAPVSRAPALSSSAAPKQKKVQRGSHVVRGAKGRFLPTKPRPEPSVAAALSDAAVFKQCEAILKKLMTQKCSHIFNEPVDAKKLNIPDYRDIIKHPMDLGTIKKKLDSGSYSSPLDFAADVRLTFNNAMTYNPRGHAVHDMAIHLNKMFENRWRTIEKKLASAATAGHIEADRADSKSRNTPPVDCSEVSTGCLRQAEPLKPKMTYDEKEALGNHLTSLSEGDEEMPQHIIDLLQQCMENSADQAGDGEIEIDIHAVRDDLLFELKKHVDKILQERDQNQLAKSEPSENEAVNVSGLSHSSTNPCKGSEPIEEDVDICGNASPILIEKDAQIRSGKFGSPSSSSSDSESSSSDSDSGSDSESDSEKVGSPGKLAKEPKKSDQMEQEKSDVISPADANRPADMELCEQDSESKPAPEGENSEPDRQVSPDKLLRAALLRSRYADVIVKARGILSQFRVEINRRNWKSSRRKRKHGCWLKVMQLWKLAELRLKPKLSVNGIWRGRKLVRNCKRQMERTVEINDNLHPKDLEMLGTATAEHIVSSVDETSPERSQDGMPGFLPGPVNPLHQLGLFMKVDDEEDEEEPSVPSSKDSEEGEIN
ncbi:hypothetical protein EJB05_20942 [Eragrostis curvula]|uniref:Bromo domain-containing protein n=1 Tax=Eragrostis curvula TaxID=38414 RepID=A0A5J9V1L2_9POAL|nr:hypothetical protein EJB05_20942 [Eragrostis curvula]